MPVFRSLVFAAALAGLVAGLFATLAQLWGTTPLLQAAEALEHAGGAAHAHAAWAPADGLPRLAFTALANLVLATGFALLLLAGFALRGRPVGWREGLLWGLAGFAAFALAPSLGLPPELPGAAAAPLGARQAWWIATAVATAAGLALLAFRRTPASALAAVALLAAPHLVGAPLPAEAHHAIPESLARSFAAAATVTSFLFWALLGVLCALLFPQPAAARRPA